MEQKLWGRNPPHSSRLGTSPMPVGRYLALHSHSRRGSCWLPSTADSWQGSPSVFNHVHTRPLAIHSFAVFVIDIKLSTDFTDQNQRQCHCRSRLRTRNDQTRRLAAPLDAALPSNSSPSRVVALQQPRMVHSTTAAMPADA